MGAFFRSMFESEAGAVSFARVASGLIVIASIAWVTIIVLHNHEFPEFGGLAIYIAALYGINKATEIISILKKGGPPPSA